MLYHVSSVGNIKTLQPRVSSHGKPYVYATKSLELALLFGSSKSRGDLDGILDFNQKGTVRFSEGYEGALKRRFEGESCYIYTVSEEAFEEGKTSFAAEVVSEKPVKVLSCEKVEDLYKYLRELTEAGKVDLQLFKNQPEYVEMINKHIEDRIMRWGVSRLKEMAKKNTEVYRFLKEKYPEVVDRCMKGNDENTKIKNRIFR